MNIPDVLKSDYLAGLVLHNLMTLKEYVTEERNMAFKEYKKHDDCESLEICNSLNKSLKKIKKELKQRDLQTDDKKPKRLNEAANNTKQKLTDYVKEIEKLKDNETHWISTGETTTGMEFAKKHKELLNKKEVNMIIDSILFYIKNNEYELATTKKDGIEEIKVIQIKDSWTQFCKKNKILTHEDKKNVKSILFNNDLADVSLVFPDDNGKMCYVTTWLIVRTIGEKEDKRVKNLPNAQITKIMQNIELIVNFTVFKSILKEAFIKQQNIDIGRGYHTVPALQTNKMNRIINYLNSAGEFYNEKGTLEKVKVRYDDNYKRALDYVIRKFKVGSTKRKKDFEITYQEIIEKTGFKVTNRMKRRKDSRIKILKTLISYIQGYIRDEKTDPFPGYQTNKIGMDHDKESFVFKRMQPLLF